jgi:ATP-binding cassette subfamily A (ABC1) protein 3
VCDGFLDALRIRMYERNLVQELSGGNRRKVSLAVALLGSPPTAYLDEPSTGLDPVACRHMWRLLSKIAEAATSALVLTTHNMLECQAVCGRVGIMKRGALVALGDSQHLRAVHGTGYMLEVAVADPGQLGAAKAFVAAKFAGAVVVDETDRMCNFELPRSAVPQLAEAFTALEAAKLPLGLTDYALCQSTLEQVFLKAIRLTAKDYAAMDAEEVKAVVAMPDMLDYVIVWGWWLISPFPLFGGGHHTVMRNYKTAAIYFWTFNEVL